MSLLNPDCKMITYRRKKKAGNCGYPSVCKSKVCTQQRISNVVHKQTPADKVLPNRNQRQSKSKLYLAILLPAKLDHAHFKQRLKLEALAGKTLRKTPFFQCWEVVRSLRCIWVIHRHSREFHSKNAKIIYIQYNICTCAWILNMHIQHAY